jgi:hypothetical protein
VFYAERFPNPTRALSPRQLPTDHDPAVSTRVYQSDQSSRQFLGCYRLCCPKMRNGSRFPGTAASAYAPLRRAPLRLRRLAVLFSGLLFSS